jgi:hypothetical protein
MWGDREAKELGKERRKTGSVFTRPRDKGKELGKEGRKAWSVFIMWGDQVIKERKGIPG